MLRNHRLTSFATLFLAFLAHSASTLDANVVHRINTGGPAYVDSLGNEWSADSGFNTGNTFSVSNPINGTPDPALYQSERWDPSGSPELIYSLAVDPGSFIVRLHFADTYSGTNQPGARVFDVEIEGLTVLSGFDIVAEVGPLTATVKEFVVDVVDTSLEIAFTHVVENPKISAIEVIETGGGGTNQAPTITSSPVTTATEGQPYSYDVQATDPDTGNTLAYTLEIAPSGAGIDGATGLITWTPSTAQVGTHKFTVRVTDDGVPALFDEQAFTVTVSGAGNQPPTITSSPVTTATEGQPYSYDVQATDPDTGDTLAYTLEIAPTGAGIDDATGLITWTPSTAQVGTQNFTVRVTDDGAPVLFDEQAFTVTVSGAGNQPPTITSSPVITATEDQLYSYDVQATDPDTGNTLAYTLEIAPVGAGIDGATGLITWTPSTAQVGTQNFTVRVTDDGAPVLFDEQAFTVTVSGAGNQPPTITSSPVTTATEGQPYSYDVQATDPDAGDTLAYTLEIAPTGATINSATGLISWTPSTAQVGTQNFTVRVTDDGASVLFDEQAFVVDVSPLSAARYRINTGGPAYIDSLGNAWSADTGFNTGNAYSVSSPINGTPDPALYQSERWDPSGSPELIYSLAVDSGSYIVRLHFADTYSGTNQPGARVFDVAIEGLTVLSGFDIVAEVGPLTATVKEFVVDVVDSSLEIAFTHVIQNPKISAIEVIETGGGGTNQAPTITSSPVTTATEGQPYSYDVQATDPDTGDTLAYTLEIAPTGATINSATGLISWTPSTAQVGTQSFTVRVTDDGVPALFDEQAFTVTVSGAGNQPPTITSSPVTTATEDQPYSYDVQATDPDTGDTLAYTLEIAPTGATINSATGLISWTPSTAQVGTQNFTVRVTDDGVPALFDEQAFVVDVSPLGTATYRINAGGPAYTDSLGNAWSADTGFNTGNAYSVSNPISGTPDPALYQSERWDPSGSPELIYSLAVDPGSYIVRLHFADTYSGTSQPGARVFDVEIEGLPALSGFDIVAEVGPLTATIKEFVVDVVDTSLEIAFTHVIENPKISAIEVLLDTPFGDLTTTPSSLVWGHVPLGTSGGSSSIQLENTGSEVVTISSLDFIIQSGVGHDFIVTLDGTEYVGGHVDLSHPVDVTIPVGGILDVPVEFVPTEATDNAVSLDFRGNFLMTSVLLTGAGGGETGHPFLHVVINAPAFAIDYDEDGFEDVFLEGSFSHTHEPGHALVDFEWSEGGVPFSNQADITVPFPVGSHTVSLTIQDDNIPPETLTDVAEVVVAPIDQAPGTLLLYYVAGGGDPAALLTAPPGTPDFAEQIPGLRLDNSAFEGDVMVRFVAKIDISTADTYTFQTTGGSSNILFIDGIEVTDSLALSPGVYDVDARFALNSSSELPLEVTMAQGAGPQLPIDEASITHDLSDFAPVINSLTPNEGADLGGNTVLITGLGFFREDEVVVHWGPIDLTGGQLTITPTTISLSTPPGGGLITVSVETPRGVSNSFDFDYLVGGPLPIAFSISELVPGIVSPTTLALGPDGRLYVGTQFGMIYAITLDDDYNVLDTETFDIISTLSNPHILGIAFNPFDPPSPVRLYVAHNLLFANGGSCFTGFSPYSGQISVLTGPNFNSVEPLITQLPVSNHDHGVNGMDFDTNGDLYFGVGGNTNAGVPACNIGGLPESPLSGAIIKAEISRPDFNGDIVYIETDTGLVNDDQVFGNIVDVAPGVNVSVYAPGFRNSFDLAFTTRDFLFATDNGPNGGFGAASTGPDSEGPDPDQPDEVNLVEFGKYYGHPNRNRGFYDPRQNIFRNLTEPSIPGEFTQAIASFPASTNGIVEYRANTFRGAMRGDLLFQKWNGGTFRVILTEDGRNVADQLSLPVSLGSLDITTGPGGVIFGAQYAGNKVVIAEPIESVGGLRVYDMYPWRAPATGGHPFTIGGQNFGNLSNTGVTIGGEAAVLTSVTSSKIHGIIPANATSTWGLLDAEVTVSGATVSLPNAFRYLPPPTNEPYGWRSGTTMPVALGEVASGVIDGVIYVVGEGSSVTLGYDIATETWSNPGDLAARPFTGHHHAAEVVNGKFYLFGGLHDGSPGKVQIYDPLTDSWSLGTDMPWAAGSSSSALIGGEIYVCGGIVGNNTVTDCGRYDPTADTWTFVASMIDGRNHAASATDGVKFYIFGGRGPGSGDGNVVANGFADMQIYDPLMNSWESSNDSGSTLLPLPQARGGTGKAVFYNGEFYVMGGETLNGAGATPTNTYDRVDIYDPQNNTWTLGSPMPTARHGIFPVLHNNQIYLGGGGTSSGFGQSDVLEIFAP